MTIDTYPGAVAPGVSAFDPLELAAETERIVCSGDARRYTRFTGNRFYGGISTGYTVGCNLRCVYCWVGEGRDRPHGAGKLCSADDAATKLISTARRKGYELARVSGGEPTIGWSHLTRILEEMEGSGISFILETNGILLGADPSRAADLARFECVHVRVALKGADPGGFEARTGAMGRFFELPFAAIENLARAGVSYHVAAMTDETVMPEAEHRELSRRLHDAGYRGRIEHEALGAYPMAMKRLRLAGYEVRRL